MIIVKFTCGHTMEVTDTSGDKPRCPKDGSPIMRVMAPMPRIRINLAPAKEKKDG